ncbi:YIP1 family protein [Chloroflexales bacterium ZM16-3]|nr:YIP1 family protein [Chloroflexales bacterium ZM16-3]
MIDTFNGALTLKQDLFRGMRESPDVVRRGFLLVLLVGLLVGGVQAISTMITSSNPDRMIAAIETAVDDSIQQQALAATTDEQREAVQIISDNKEGALNIVRAVMTLPTPLPRPVGVILRGLGLIASTPLSYLGSLMLAVIVTHIAARQLGGTGNIQQMLGLGALSVAPHALDALGFIPYIGQTISLIAWAWGLVILVLATSVAHRLDSGRATLAVLLYPMVGFLLLLLGCCAFFLLIIAGLGQ